MPSTPSVVLEAFRARLGSEQVRTNDEHLAEASQATFATHHRPIAIVSPGNRDEVAACLRVAAEHRVALYPVSGGKNWGYGSSVPTRGDCAILDLRRLDRIVDFDETLAYVTVEPGVTFRKLYEFLQARTQRLFLSAIGGSPDASVIGNTVERGDGTGPYGDHAAHACGLEVVLSTGEILHTGHARFGAAKTGAIHRWGVGPSLDGMFTQSNLGVITKMSVWLATYPASVEQAVVRLDDDARLPELMDALRQLRLEGTVRSTAGVWNDYKILGTTSRYPWAETKGATPIPRDLVRDLTLRAGYARWMGSLAIYGASRAQALADRQRVDDVLRSKVDSLTWDEGPTAIPWNDLARRGPTLGVPHETSLASMYWRKEGPVPERIDPHADGCGFLWCTHAVPFEGGAIALAARVTEEIVLRHGFEPHLALLATSDRVVLSAASIVYDRSIAGEDDRAMACHDELFERLVREGFYPSRLGLQSMALVPPADDDSVRVLRRIKEVLDPRGVLAPGRYER